MNLLLSTGSLWTYSVERCFALARAAGFDGLELMVDRRWETRQPAVLRPLIDRFALPVHAVHSPFMGGVPGWPGDPVARVRCSVELAEALGAAVVVHHPPQRIALWWVQAGERLVPCPVPFWRPEAGYRRWLLSDYPAYQATTAVQLCLENMPTRRVGRWALPLFHFDRLDDIVRFPRLTVDTTHLGTWGLEPVDVLPRLAGKIGHVHLSNYDGREHIRPETGDLRLDRFVRGLAESGYDGAVALELQPDVLAAGQADGVVVDRLMTSLRHVRAWARGETP